MSLLECAKNELQLLEDSCLEEDSREMQHLMNEQILEVLQVLTRQGHTGLTASYIINMVKTLWVGKPILPLIGSDDEWTATNQNKRCSSVFKGDDGKAYWSNGYVYSEPNSGSWFGCAESHRYITFPCDIRKMKTEYRKLLFPSKYIPIKWAVKFHLYRVVDK